MPESYATGKYTAAAVRSQPRERAVMETQLLLGEPVVVLEDSGCFCRIQRAEDGVEGFVLRDQLQPVSEARYLRQRDAPAFVLDLFGMMLSEHYGIPVTFGGRLPDYDGMQALHGVNRFLYSGQAVLSDDTRPDAEILLRLARKWLYVPQLRGGRTPTGVDPVAWVQLLMRVIGVSLPAALAPMCAGGRPVDFVVQCQEGDLAFFGEGRGRPTHVGILLPGSEILHVSGRVRVDGIDHFGIYDRESRRYTHRLRVVKRWLPDTLRTQVTLNKRLPDTTGDPQQILIF